MRHVFSELVLLLAHVDIPALTLFHIVNYLHKQNQILKDRERTLFACTSSPICVATIDHHRINKEMIRISPHF